MTRLVGLDDLARARPEWASWLAVVGTALRQIGDEHWNSTSIQRADAMRDTAPALARVTLELDSGSAASALNDVLRCAAGHLATAPSSDAAAVLEAALNRDEARLESLARSCDIGPELFCAAAPLAAMPLLQACARRSVVPESWSQGYCPVCGAWPALVEVRGVERSRCLRCAGCGSEWQTQCLLCAYCGNADHERLDTLVIDGDDSGATIDVCHACRGYLKVFTCLTAMAPREVLLRDLASAELDVAAAERGFSRAPRAAYALELAVVARG